MKRGMFAAGAGFLALVTSIGIATAQESSPDQPNPSPQADQGDPVQTSPSPPPSSPQPGSAQEGSPQPSPAAPQSRQTPAVPQLTAEQVTDEQVEQLVMALAEIEPLLRQASTELRSTQEAAQRQQIEAAFEQEATQIVEETGLTVDVYIQLVTLAQNDREFGQRVTDELEQLQAETSESSPSPDTVPTRSTEELDPITPLEEETEDEEEEETEETQE